MKKYKTHIIWGIVVVVALVGGFFWGKSMAATGTAGRGAYAGAASGTRAAFAARFGGAGGAGGGFVAGQVSSVGNDSLVLQLANGNSENVYFSSSTSVVVPQAASASAIQPGAMVMVGGTTDSSGNLTATTIQVRNGAGGAAGTGPGAGGAGTGSAGQ
jgi:hypothetical protein